MRAVLLVPSTLDLATMAAEAMLAYSKAVHEVAAERVRAFLAQHLR